MDPLVIVPASWIDGVEQQLAQGRQFRVQDLGEACLGEKEQIAYTVKCPGFINQALGVLGQDNENETEILKALGYFQTVLRFIQSTELFSAGTAASSLSTLVRLCFQLVRRKPRQTEEQVEAPSQTKAEVERQVVLVFLTYAASCVKTDVALDAEICHNTEEELLDWMMSPSVLARGAESEVNAISKCLRLYRILNGGKFKEIARRRGVILSGLSTYANSLKLIAHNEDQILHETVLLCPSSNRLLCCVLTVVYVLASREKNTKLLMKEIWTALFSDEPAVIGDVPYLTSFSMNLLDLLPIDGPAVKYVKDLIDKTTSGIVERMGPEQTLSTTNQLRRLWNLPPLAAETYQDKTTKEFRNRKDQDDLSGNIFQPSFDENEIKTTHLIQDLIVDMRSEFDSPDEIPKKGYLLVCLRAMRYISRIQSTDECIARIVGEWKTTRKVFPNTLKSIPYNLTPKQLAILLQDIQAGNGSVDDKRQMALEDLRSLSSVKNDQLAKSKTLQLVNQQLEEEFEESRGYDKSVNKHDDVWLARSSAWDPYIRSNVDHDNDDQQEQYQHDGFVELDRTSHVRQPEDGQPNDKEAKISRPKGSSGSARHSSSSRHPNASGDRGRGSNRRGRRWKRGTSKFDRVNAQIT